MLTFVPNLELMQKDRTATLAWTLEVDEEETILHKFTSKPDVSNYIWQGILQKHSTCDEEREER